MIREGELCKKHRAVRRGILERLSSIRNITKGEFSQPSGLKYGVVLGFPIDGDHNRADIVLVKKSPELYLCVELGYDVQNLVRERGKSIGDYMRPTECTWQLDNLLDGGNPLCLLGILAKRCNVCPPYVLIMERNCVIRCPDRGWVSSFPGKPQFPPAIHNDSIRKTNENAKRRIVVPKVRLRSKSSAVMGEAIIRESWNDLSPAHCFESTTHNSIWEELEAASANYSDFILDTAHEESYCSLAVGEKEYDSAEGDPGHDEIRKCREVKGELYEELLAAFDSLRGEINTDVYYVTRNTKIGVVTCRIKDNLVESTRQVCAQSRIDLGKYHGSRYLHNSMSCTVGFYSFEECVDILSERCDWHSHWIFRTKLDFSTKPYFATRSEVYAFIKSRSSLRQVSPDGYGSTSLPSVDYPGIESGRLNLDSSLLHENPKVQRSDEISNMSYDSDSSSDGSEESSHFPSVNTETSGGTIDD